MSLETDPPIHGFFDQYRFMSNFHYVEVTWDGVVYPTTEHAYQAAKSLDPSVRERIRSASTPAIARRWGQEIQLRDNWDQVKISVMRILNERKYRDPELRAKLLATGDSYLEETNWWKDVFWGVCDGKGQNNLGKILMYIRSKIRNGE